MIKQPKMKDLQKFSGTICAAWEKENVKGKMQHYIQLEDDSIYSAFGSLPEDLIIGAKASGEFSTTGIYKNLESYKILGQDTLPRPTKKLPPQAALDDITLKDIWALLNEIKIDIAKLGVKD